MAKVIRLVRISDDTATLLAEEIADILANYDLDDETREELANLADAFDFNLAIMIDIAPPIEIED